VLNDELAAIFEEMADMEEIEGRKWQSIAYRKAAASISTAGGNLIDLYRSGRLRDIDGVGEAIEAKIRDYIEKGKIEKYDEMKARYPIDFASLRKLQGLGPKKIYALFTALGVKDIETLKAALNDHSISGLQGFGEKSEESLRKAVEVFEKYGANRRFLAEIYDEIQEIKKKLAKSSLFEDLEIAGSFRRMRETVGDIDILGISSNPEKGREFFTNLDDVAGIISSGPSKMTVRLKNGLTCDFRIFARDSFGAAMQYFTGSKEHNVQLREIAISKGMKLNEYGLYEGDRVKAGSDEATIYRALGLEWIEPELRENMGEIEAAGAKRLPRLVEYGSIRGDLHTHTVDTDGRNTLEQMVGAASASGLEYIAITNHSKGLKVAKGLTDEGFRSFNRKIDSMNEKSSIRIFKGVELEILKDGSLDLDDSTLQEMDFVLAALHQGVVGDANENTARVVKAIGSGKIHSLAHPTGRLIGSREAYRLNFERIFEACKENQVFIEINGYPERSDLPFDLVKKAREYGILFTLGSDSHSTKDLRNLHFATAIARRGWLDKESVVNTLNADHFTNLIRR
jgi:DNA polymerase (family 10)